MERVIPSASTRSTTTTSTVSPRRAGKPDHGASGTVEVERGLSDERDADDLQPGLRNLARNIVSENISLKHYMNTTWVSRPIPADMPSPQELFGDFYVPEMDE